MKKLLVFLLLFCELIAVYAQNTNSFQIDMNKFPANNDNKSMFYDKETKTFTVKKSTSGTSIYQWLDINISEYNVVRVKYKSLTDYGFHIFLDYPYDNDDWSTKSTYCPSYLNEMVILIKPNHKKLNGICINAASNMNNQKFIIESISFEQIENPQETDIFISDEKPVIDAAKKGAFNDSISAWDFVKNLGVGFQYSAFFINSSEQDYGMDCHHVWGYPKPTKEQIRFIKEKGFKTLRLQTSPGTHLLDENYTIDPRFLKELKEFVDWALREDMYVIICGPSNDFMDNPYWQKKIKENDVHYKNYLVEEKSKKASEEFIKAIWKQYATAFNNSYDERLIFETLNEPVDRFHEHNFCEKTDCSVCKKDFAILNEYNQLIVDTIRSTGGNNEKRFIMVEGLGAGWKNITNNLFKMPKDKTNDRLIPALHNYPMGPGSMYSKKLYTKNIKKQSITDMFEALDEYYFSKHIPVYISEVGHDRSIPVLERINCIKDFMKETVADNRSCSVVMMDNSDIDCTYDCFGYSDKQNLKWMETEYIDTLLYAAQNKEFPLTNEFIEKNATKKESILGKNLLDAPKTIKKWDNAFVVNTNVYSGKLPETYKIEFNIKKTGNSPILFFEWSDSNWKNHPIFTDRKKIQGGTLNNTNVAVKKEIVTIEIDSKTAEDIAGSEQLVINGQDIIINSIKFIE